MDPATHARASWVAAAGLLAVLALVVMRGTWASAGASEIGAAQEAATCGGSRLANPAAAMEIAVAEAMEETRRQQAEAAADPSAWVVLNNRGYNYGPPHPVRIDADVFLEADPAAR